jgi:murein DD-endopeptidase MepM/ murein hydrolase activator NlpD
LPRKEVSVIVSANYSTRIIRTTQPLWLVRLVVGLAVGAGLVATAAFVLALSGAFRFAQLGALRQRNRFLEAEFRKVGALRQELARLEEQSRRMASMLGIEKTPAPVNWDSAPLDSVALPEWLKGNAWGSQPVPKLVPIEKYAVSLNQSEGHEAVDLAASSGSPVRATADGVVEARGTDRTFGRFVLLRHAQGYESYYGHLQDWNVDKGDTASAGQTIGWVGSTGKSTAPHLHFEIRRNGKPIDPASLVKF